MTILLRGGWFAAGVVGLLAGCGSLEVQEEAGPTDALAEALTNTCQNPGRDYTFVCATVYVYKTATSTTPIDTIPCGGAYWVANLVESCPSNGRFLADYRKDFDPTPARGWIDRTVLAPAP
ncbi:hypothetical protein CYFUS_009142 [Cystobacter fuscus]|uniref:Lipoprotein n=1 Tax=Cystobacter fuscus TaxID=43 RepID=A0A250JJK8_9BACT|nr:hypothetical protein [Cystobacter fuscus]ATB43662.1 hypothetical protein CYFUS_009142 [Cystobacter fuscus]